MLSKTTLKALLCSIIFLSTYSSYSQVGINTTTPSDDSMLDVVSTNKGLLVPRVNISNLNNIAPITGGSTESLLVYNTNTTTGKGFYYWDSTKWVLLNNSDDWKKEGNSGTTPGTATNQNFVGTSDNQNLIIARNRQNRIQLNSTSTVLNEDGDDIDFRLETDNQSNMIFVDGDTNAIGIGTNLPNGILELNSSNNGLVLPRIALQATNVQAPVVNPRGAIALEPGTTIYNTATAGTSPNNVAPGLYFWNGTRWVAFAGSPGGLDWTLTGNSGTTPITNYIGTTDATPLVISTDATPRLVANAGTGEIFVNSLSYIPNFMFSSFASGAQTSIGALSSGTGIAMNSQNTGGGIASLAYATGNTGAINISTLSTGNGILASGSTNITYSFPTESSGGVFTGHYGASGIGLNATSTGLLGLGQGRTNVVTNTTGSGIASSGNTLGIYAYAGFGDTSNSNRGNAAGEFTLDADNDVLTNSGNDGTRARAKLAGFDNVTPNGILTNRDSYYGGYFSGGSESSGTPSYAYVGMRYRTNNNGNGTSGGSGQDYKIIGTGSVSTLIDGPDGNPRVMFAPEAPEILFQDFGVGKLINGIARIDIDPIIKNAIHVDEENPLKVYVTLEGECNGIYVTNKSGDGFTVKELQEGKNNAAFSWQIVATRADRVATDGTMVSKHVGIRLPEGPGPVKPLEYKTSILESQKQELIDSDKVKKMDKLNIEN